MLNNVSLKKCSSRKKLFYELLYRFAWIPMSFLIFWITTLWVSRFWVQSTIYKKLKLPLARRPWNIPSQTELVLEFKNIFWWQTPSVDFILLFSNGNVTLQSLSIATGVLLSFVRFVNSISLLKITRKFNSNSTKMNSMYVYTHTHTLHDYYKNV